MHCEYTYWVCDFSEVVSAKKGREKTKLGLGLHNTGLINVQLTKTVDCRNACCGEKPCEWGCVTVATEFKIPACVQPCRDASEELRIKKTVDAWINTLGKEIKVKLSSHIISSIQPHLTPNTQYRGFWNNIQYYPVFLPPKYSLCNSSAWSRMPSPHLVFEIAVLLSVAGWASTTWICCSDEGCRER